MRLSTAIRSGLPITGAQRHCRAMGTKSRESIYGASIRASAERAKEARKEADRLACVAWNQRMLGFKGPARPSPALGDALNAGYLCLGCDTHQTVALNIVGRRQRPSTGWNATCAARIVRRFAAIPISEAISWRRGRPRFRPLIRHQHGGPGER